MLTWRVAQGNGRIPTGSSAGSTSHNGYLVVRIGRRPYLAHRLAWLITFGTWPEKALDHINGQRLDNRLCNLREATTAENGRNRKVARHNACGVTGVYFNKGRWQASIRIGTRRTYLGRFDTLVEAAAARRTAEMRYFGDFAPRA